MLYIYFLISGLDLLIEAFELNEPPVLHVQPQDPSAPSRGPGAQPPTLHKAQHLRPTVNKNKKQKCVIDYCPSPNNISYHSFPKCEMMRSEWKKLCTQTDILRSSKVCETHFSASSYRKLKSGILRKYI